MQRANRKIPGAWVLSRYWQENKGKASPNTEMKSQEKKQKNPPCLLPSLCAFLSSQSGRSHHLLATVKAPNMKVLTFLVHVPTEEKWLKSTDRIGANLAKRKKVTLWVGPNGPIHYTIIIKTHNWHQCVMCLNLNAHKVPKKIPPFGVLLQAEKWDRLPANHHHTLPHPNSPTGGDWVNASIHWCLKCSLYR